MPRRMSGREPVGSRSGMQGGAPCRMGHGRQSMLPALTGTLRLLGIAVEAGMLGQIELSQKTMHIGSDQRVADVLQQMPAILRPTLSLVNPQHPEVRRSRTRLGNPKFVSQHAFDTS